VLKALHLASEHLDRLENRPKAAEIIARPAYINCPPEIILERLLSKYDYGDGRKEQDTNYLEAMKELSVTRKIAEIQKFTLFDGGTFDSTDPEKYARSFQVNSLAGSRF
jgi:nitrate/nitrite transport system substrate-binding protein